MTRHLAGTDEDLGNNLPQKPLRRTVRLDTRIVRMYARTIRTYGRAVCCCMRIVRRCMRMVRLGSLGFAQYVAAQVHVSVIHF
jgi:hypothetical protein